MDKADWALVLAVFAVLWHLHLMVRRVRDRVAMYRAARHLEAALRSGGPNGPPPIDREPKPTPAPPAKVYPTGRCANENPNPAPAGPPPVVVTKPGVMR